jgi:1-deoxyxylulose-5-phosphate synthase
LIEMEVMRYIDLPGISQPVSVLSLGTATRIFTPETYDQAEEVLDAFVGAGGNCIDAAHIYGFGASEKILGRWIDKRKMRGQVVLVGKGCHPVVDPQNLFGKPWEPRVTPEAIHADLMESLERLQTDMIDLYLLHRDDESMPVGPLVQALNAQQAEGRILAFGASNWSTARIDAANAYAVENGLNGFVVSSLQFSLARPERMHFPGTVPASQADLAWHARKQFPLLAWSALSAGYVRHAANPEDPVDDPIAQTYDAPANYERMRRAKELARRKGFTLLQVALAYVLIQPFPVLAAIGPTTLKHLDELLGSLQVMLDDPEIAYLEQRSI